MGLDFCVRSLQGTNKDIVVFLTFQWPICVAKSTLFIIVFRRETVENFIFKTKGYMGTNSLVPLVRVGPEISSKADNLSKISWTAVSADSHSTFVITSNVECVAACSRSLEKNE